MLVIKRFLCEVHPVSVFFAEHSGYRITAPTNTVQRVYLESVSPRQMPATFFAIPVTFRPFLDRKQ